MDVISLISKSLTKASHAALHSTRKLSLPGNKNDWSLTSEEAVKTLPKIGIYGVFYHHVNRNF